MSGVGCAGFAWHFFRFLAKQVLLTYSSFGMKTKWAAHPRVRRFRLNFFFGSYRSGFRSHFPRFERKQKWAKQVCAGRLKFFSFLSEAVFAHIFPVSNENKNELRKCAPVSLAFLFGSYRSGFRSHFPTFERKRKSATYPSPGSLSAFSLLYSQQIPRWIL